MKKEINYVGTALAINVTQLIFCFILYIIGSVLNLNNFFLAAVILVVQVFIWFVCATRFTVGKNDITKNGELILGIIYTLSPILILTIITFVVALVIGEDTGWNHFFFLGAPLIFYNQPALIISRFISENAYAVFFINYALLAVVMFIGGRFGMLLKNIGKKKSKKQDEDEDNEEVVPIEMIIEEKVEEEDTKEEREPVRIAGAIDHERIMNETVDITRENELNEIDVDKFISETKESLEETSKPEEAKTAEINVEAPREIQKKQTRQRPIPKRKRDRRRPVRNSEAVNEQAIKDKVKQEAKPEPKAAEKPKVQKKKSKDSFDGNQVRIEDFINND